MAFPEEERKASLWEKEPFSFETFLSPPTPNLPVNLENTLIMIALLLPKMWERFDLNLSIVSFK